MDARIRLPKIDGRTEREQLEQIRSFLIQLVNELNATLANIDINKK